MGKKVTFARFHQELFIPGSVGLIGNTLPPASKQIPGLEMSQDEHGLKVEAKGTVVLVPYANVVFMVLAPEAAPAKK